MGSNVKCTGQTAYFLTEGACALLELNMNGTESWFEGVIGAALRYQGSEMGMAGSMHRQSVLPDISDLILMECNLR